VAVPWTRRTTLIKTRAALGCPGLPDFHVLGIWMHFFYPFYTGRPVGVFRPTAPRPPPVASPTTIMAALKVLKPTMTMVIPSLLEAWIHDKDAVACLKAMGSVVSTSSHLRWHTLTSSQQHYGGGPLSTAVGDALVAQGVHLRTGYGSTECGVVTAFESPQIANEDWAWAELAATVTVRWKPQGDGTSELQVLRGEKHVVHVENLPDVRGYATQDLWVPHPTKEGLWRM
jgi:acyl-CoA synthetase (AMP-forming)/AMP-acid ligase II